MNYNRNTEHHCLIDLWNERTFTSISKSTKMCSDFLISTLNVKAVNEKRKYESKKRFEKSMISKNANRIMTRIKKKKMFRTETTEV